MSHVPVPFDRELADELPRIYELLAPDGVTPATIESLRGEKGIISAPSLDELVADGAYVLDTVDVPGMGDDPAVRLLICRPSGHDVRGVVFHVHGGGLVAGDARNGLVEVIEWASPLHLAIVSVDYRLAPETPFPGALHDCLAGLIWTQENADELGSEMGRIVVVGASAGGGLAAAMSLLARDHGRPPVAALMLLAPMLDDRNDTASARQMAGLGVWDRASNATGWSAYLGETRDEDVSIYAAPARSSDVSGLPPVYIDVGSAETFRSESVAFAESIWASGGVAALHVWPGGFHASDAMVPDARISVAARRTRRDWLEHRIASWDRPERE